jgi:hypothetical protein
VADLPLGGQRVFTYLARLTPGVVPGESNRDRHRRSMSVNGVRSLGQNNFLLNGVDNNVNVIDFLNGAAFVIGPPPEAIGEMQVLTSGYNAEYGRAAGGVINVNLKTGTNQIHGGVWEILQNEDLNANSWQNNSVGAPKPNSGKTSSAQRRVVPLSRIAVSSSAITRARGFRTWRTPGFITIPTPAEIKGELLEPARTRHRNRSVRRNRSFLAPSTIRLTQTTVNGQLTRTPFPKTRFPPAVRSGLGQDAGALSGAEPARAERQLPEERLLLCFAGPKSHRLRRCSRRYRLSDKNSFYGSFSINDNNNSSKQVFAQGLGSRQASGGDVPGDCDQIHGQVGYTRVWTPDHCFRDSLGHHTAGNIHRRSRRQLGGSV